MRRHSRRRCSPLSAALIVHFLIDNRVSGRISRILPRVAGEETPGAPPGVSHQEGGVFLLIDDGPSVAARSPYGCLAVAQFKDGFSCRVISTGVS